MGVHDVGVKRTARSHSHQARGIPKELHPTIRGISNRRELRQVAARQRKRMPYLLFISVLSVRRVKSVVRRALVHPLRGSLLLKKNNWELRLLFPVVASEMRKARQVSVWRRGLRPALLTVLFLLWLFMGKARAA